MTFEPEPDGRALTGLRVIELAAKGPGPFGVMLLADLGADVIRVDRVPDLGEEGDGSLREMGRGRRSIGLDLKQEAARELLLRLVDGADVLVEGYRPGVAEKLGFGPEVCLERNPRLVYARVTGWGQEGPLASVAAHDINYLALSGALGLLGAGDRPPPPPLNLIGDFGGGGPFLAIGIMAALLERERSGKGQIVDAAMVDGILAMLTAFHDLRNAGIWSEDREDNIVDGGAPWYRCYETADGGYVAVGALEPRFFALLLDKLGLDRDSWPMHDRTRWASQRKEMARIFAARPRRHWEQLFEGSDACVSPVLGFDESVADPHIASRGSFVARDGKLVPQAAPRLRRTPAAISAEASAPGANGDEILDELDLSQARRRELRETGALA